MAGTQKNPEQEIKKEGGKSPRRKPGACKGPLAEPLAVSKNELTVTDDGCTPVQDSKAEKKSVWNAMSKDELIGFINEELPNIAALSKEAEAAMATIRTALEQIARINNTSDEAQKAQAALDRLNEQFRELNESLGIDQTVDGEILDVQKAFDALVKRYLSAATEELLKNQSELHSTALEELKLAHAKALEQKAEELALKTKELEQKDRELAQKDKELAQRQVVAEAAKKVLAVGKVLETHTAANLQRFLTGLDVALTDKDGQKVTLAEHLVQNSAKVDKLEKAFIFLKDQFAALLEIMQDVVKYVRNVIVSVFKGQAIENVGAMLNDIDEMDANLTEAIEGIREDGSDEESKDEDSS